MFRNLKYLGLAAAISISAAAVPTAADARDRYYDRDDDAAIAIGAGLVGLAIGAAIADDGDRYYYRDRPYYRAYPSYYYERRPRYYRYDRRSRWHDDRRWRGDRGYRHHRYEHRREHWRR